MTASHLSRIGGWLESPYLAAFTCFIILATSPGARVLRAGRVSNTGAAPAVARRDP